MQARNGKVKNFMKFPRPIQNLIDVFSTLPTVGPKTAERYVFYLLKKDPEELKRFAASLSELKDGLFVCKNCFAVAESDPCPNCVDAKRNDAIICVVSDSRDMIAMESTGQFKGKYHILGGTINAIEGIKPEQLKIAQLVDRIAREKTEEIILALNPNFEGETTAMYLAKLLKLKYKNLKISRLAKGLPMGADLEYADEITLSNSLKYRNYL